MRERFVVVRHSAGQLTTESPLRRVVVVGASAGGLDPLLRLLGALPPDLGAPVLVARHRPRAVLGEVPGLLARATRLPVVVAEDAAPIEAGRVYLAPPHHHLLVEPDHVVVSGGPPDDTFRPSIDTLFRSAAHAYGPRVIGVVLAGTGEDGARGLVSIKRAGGVAIVQRLSAPPFAAIPSRAIAEVRIDHILAPAEAGRVIGRLVDATPAGTS